MLKATSIWPCWADLSLLSWPHGFIWCTCVICHRSWYRQPELLLTCVCSETETVQLYIGMLNPSYRLCWDWNYFGDSDALCGCSASKVKLLSFYYPAWCENISLDGWVLIISSDSIIGWAIVLHTSCSLCIVRARNSGVRVPFTYSTAPLQIRHKALLIQSQSH